MVGEGGKREERVRGKGVGEWAMVGKGNEKIQGSDGVKPTAERQDIHS